MKKSVLAFALIIGLLTSASTLQAQTVNMDSYITLTVKNGAAIRLDFQAAADGTPVRIVSGSTDTTVTVGTGWKGYTSYTADGTTMTVYGDIIGFGCKDNVANLTALNVSNNTELRWLYCYGNAFSTAALNDIYCSLPNRIGKDNGVIQPVFNSSSSNYATVKATNAQNAIDKNWWVRTKSGNDITTNGTYVCQANTSRYITLTVAKDSAIKLDFQAAAEGTPVRIVSGSKTRNITVGTSWYDGGNPSSFTVTAGDTVMTVYGDIIGFNCYNNGESITGLDPSHNTQLTELWCNDNHLSSLDVSKNILLEWLYCGNNPPLNSIDVSKNTQLKGLDCNSNSLGSLDVSQNTQLWWLYCHINNLEILDVSNNTYLKLLSCHSNHLRSLDVSKNTYLWLLTCFDNAFTISTLDDIYCALPVRQASDGAVIHPVYGSSSSNNATVKATNAANATTKNWKVQYFYPKNTDITTNGGYVCGTPHTDISEATAEPALTLYPNPVADVLYLSATARTVRIYNIYGIEVAHAADTDRIDVAHLPAGIYTVRADGTVAKMVKR